MNQVFETLAEIGQINSNQCNEDSNYTYSKRHHDS